MNYKSINDGDKTKQKEILFKGEGSNKQQIIKREIVAIYAKTFEGRREWRGNCLFKTGH